MKYFFVFLFIVALAIANIDLAESEKQIVGKWEEVEWNYEKGGRAFENIAMKDVKKHIAEVWEFKPDHTLLLHKGGQQIARAKWSLKSRGDIISIVYEDGEQELYSIKALRPESMTVHYDIEMEVRGVASITFQREKEAVADLVRR